MRRRKLIIIAAVIAMTAALGSGCAKNKLGNIDLEAGESGLYIDGTTVSYGMRETFDKSYYDKKELESVIDSEVSQFNSSEYAASTDAMSVNTYKVKSKEAYIVFDFKTYSDYVSYVTNYNQVPEDEIFLGSIADANETFSIDASFVSANDEKSVVDSSDVLGNDYNILIINESFKVEVVNGAVYMSDNCEADNGIITTSADETSYIIFK